MIQKSNMVTATVKHYDGEEDEYVLDTDEFTPGDDRLPRREGTNTTQKDMGAGDG
ncbi:hypothetical protein [Paraburkholderia sp.]|uniref:hypothetical protein n=1 Tax=Paraburkholderia sp. TaxID=1926495 RepID=UPI0039E2BD41